tara:strand:+ start:48 stop:416 length:369 start_codon:yes stop_codon:yes gene_type:complete
MSSLGLITPITYDSTDGFAMSKTLGQVIKQNLKMLLLTNPGERVMDPEFGVGMQQFLFRSFSENVQSEITERVRSQVGIYMPAVVVQDIQFYSRDPDNNSLSFRIIYYVPEIGVSDLLQFTI